MSTTFESTSNVSNLGMTTSPAFVHTFESSEYKYAVTHVFLPVELPEMSGYTLGNDFSLARAVCAAAHAYTTHIYGTSEESRWRCITKMLDSLQASVQSERMDKHHVITQLRGMQTGDILPFFIRPQNAAIILMKGENSTTCESFEVSPRRDAVEKTPGSLICSYPWSAVETPNEVFEDRDFQLELANFLSLSSAVDSDFLRPPLAHPQYVTALLTGILRDVGRIADVTRVTKRIRDNVSHRRLDCAGRRGDWRRSSLWLLIRVAIQTSVDRSPLGCASYKRFMLYFICTLARDENNATRSSDLLHLMSSKILRRLRKIGSLTPDWLSEKALETYACLREILDARWKQLSVRASPFQNPSQDELARDTRLSLLDSGEYIRGALANPSTSPRSTAFHPSHHRRGTIGDFLSSNGSFFDEAYAADPVTTLYDVERSVEHIDEWLASVTDVNDACAQLEILMDKYVERASRGRFQDGPEDASIKFLTMIELCIAVDKLVVQEIPMLADYSPEIPTAFLERLLLRRTTSLHRLFCAYQYLAARQLRSRSGWSVLSNEFTENSFPVRYYDQSVHLQQLKVCIEEEAKKIDPADAGLQPEVGDVGLALTHDGHQPEEQSPRRQLVPEGAGGRSPLPVLLSHAKVVVFELQCPSCIRIWRSAVAQVWYYNGISFKEDAKKHRPLADVPELQPYLVERQEPLLHLQIRFAYFYQEGLQFRNSPTLRYVVHHSELGLSELDTQSIGHDFSYDSPFHRKEYANSNDVLAAQADCPADLSLDEFIASAHLRSGGSLRWLNILHGLRSRTLNLRRRSVHYLIARAAFQVGPLDLNTGMWIWHQELQDSSFCNALLDELDGLFVDGAGLIDAMFMSTISLLLTRVLASSPSEDVSERTIILLRGVRRKTFGWVQESSYDLEKAPTNLERRDLLLHMASTCRSTFDSDPAIHCKLFHSVEDVDALLSCAFLIQVLRPAARQLLRGTDTSGYSKLLLERDSRLSSVLEGILRDVIINDPSDYGIDLAVAKIFATYRPGAHRWKPLRYPNARWLICETKAIRDQRSQTVYVNLLDGSLQLDGQPLGGVPCEIRNDPQLQWIFRDQALFVTPSDLPGMDFTTLATTSEYKVHFSRRGGNLVVRAQCNQTNEVLELIPSRKLQKDLPPALVNGHVHWLNLSEKIIEIRPLEQPWKRSSENWRIDCASRQYNMIKGRNTLVDIRSPTWAMVSKCFDCLDVERNQKTLVNIHSRRLGVERNGKSQTCNILLTASPVEPVQPASMLQLSVTLPRYGLSFFVNERGELESRDFKDMVYDENQCVDALFGLENLLVLRPKTYLAGSFISETLIPRRILVPNGFPQEHDGHQVRVNASVARDEPSYHIYDLDTELGCLVGNGSLISTRFLAYLHAATNYHRSDPLTGKTGAQTALCLLQSAGCQSIMELKALPDHRPHTMNPAVGSFWSSTKYPQINAAHREIQNRYYWGTYYNHGAKVNSPQKRAERRAAHLFPSTVTVRTSMGDCRDMEYLIPGLDLELEDSVSTAVFAAHCWFINAPTMNTISNWADLWNGLNIRVDTVLPGSGIQSNPDLVQILISRTRDILEKEEKHHRFPLLFLFPMVAYCLPPHHWQAAFLSMLTAFAGQMKSHLDDPQTHSDCNIVDGYRPTEGVLRDHIHRSCINQRGLHLYSGMAAIQRLLQEWPCEIPPTISLDPRYYDMAGLTASLKQLFSSCHRNFDLKQRLMHVLAVPELPTFPHRVSPPQYISNANVSLQITLDQLLSNRTAPELPQRSAFPRDGSSTFEASNYIPALGRLFCSLQTNTAFQQEYLALLETSASVHKKDRTTYNASEKDRTDRLQKHYAQCRVNYMDALGNLKRNLCPMTDHEHTLEQLGRWPLITADVLLRCLASTSPVNLPGRWKRCLISFALLLLEFQRARRLLRFALDGLEEELFKELDNEGCDGWNAEEYPDWLLIQIQGNFLIHRTQAETAIEMISPRSGENTMMQVNMGEGKSSVIIPIVAAALADGNQLVRVIVPKSLTVQMFETLVARLGGLTNRPIYHLPFSRTPEYHFGQVISPKIDDLHNLMSQCMIERGILLVQPEHTLSLKLMSVEEQICEGQPATDPLTKQQMSIYSHIKTALSLRLIPEDSLVGSIFRWWGQSPNHSVTEDVVRVDHHDEHSENTLCAPDNPSKWLSLQKWLHSRARDILDESDEILHSRFQLIYTIGLEQHMDGYPDRWTITQQILRLVKEAAHTISRNHPSWVEYGCGPPASFPRVRIVRGSDVGQRLISMIVEDVIGGRLPNFKFQQLTRELRGAIRSFISDKGALEVPDTVKRVEEYAKRFDRGHLWSGLLLLRGLLASNILLFALVERRWRVDYGLALQPPPRKPGYAEHSLPSTMLAVPYRAKDVPAPNTQFGHPDITIILTCLSYYYTGLTEEQLRISFEILLDQDDPSTEYALWVKEHDEESVPESLRKLRDINLKSSDQWDKVVFPLFSRNQATIDFYLARVVFPKEAKEFPWKLYGSSWDLVEKREKLITGFSGTNDGRWLLPMSVTQHDLDHQRGTNASVLSYLLQPENDFYMVTQENGEQQTTLKFLRSVTAQRPEIRVLLDVGAQILDFSNDQVAAAWLGIDRAAAGAIYFSENDELTVLPRNGTTQPLSSSPLSQQLDRCVVYLDHAHTRGTDLKFPIGSRAAITLGPKVTKDAMIQGCMRMRKLGHGHSVMFFAPLGVDQSIRAVAGKNDPTTIVTTVDILCWAIHETWTDIEQWAPYWAQQGISHKMRYDAWSRFCNNELTRERLSEAWLQPEGKSLADLYAPHETKHVPSDLSAVPGMQQWCKDLGVLSFPSAQLEEEQEREVNREREREREMELPPRAEPAEHFLHPDVVSFVKTGVIPPLYSGSAFLPVFATLEKSSAATPEADVWSSFILATADFCKTIKPESTKGTMDQYLRPVQWILSCKTDRGQVLVLLSPFEAEHLLVDVRMSEYVHLHVYAPRASKRMKPCDDLRLYSIPPLPSDWTPPWDLIDQLNVFAGQVYLRDYESYLRLCSFLGVPTREPPNDTTVGRNLFNIPGSFEETEIMFSGSPLPSVMALLSIRNRGRPFTQTHMGKILQGQLLTKSDF